MKQKVYLLLMALAVMMSVSMMSCKEEHDEEQLPVYPDVGFADIGDVFASLKPTDQVVFLLRHAERGADYSINGLLTENGKLQAQSVGKKIRNGEQAFYAHSNYGRTKQTCENIAIGRGDDFVDDEEWDILTGDWYRKDLAVLEEKGWDNWQTASQWAYEGGFEEGFYNLDERSEEWLDSLKQHLPSMKRINVLVSHDYMVSAMAIYASNRQVDMHYWKNNRWLNYLAGVAIIIDQRGLMRMKTIRGLDSGVLILDKPF